MNNNAKILSETEIDNKEYELFLLLKPYIAQCLSLNHELNNPLAGIIGYLDLFLAETGNLSDEQQEQLEKIMISAEKINEVITDLSKQKIELNKVIDLKAALEQFSKN